MAELERESLSKLAELETELGALKVEYADALEARRLVEEELAALKRQKQDSARRQSVLESKIIELETLTGTLTKGSSGLIHCYYYYYLSVSNTRCNFMDRNIKAYLELCNVPIKVSNFDEYL